MDKQITHIEGRRWFQRTYDTYHTATIFFSDGTREKSKKTYGYGEQYLTTAAKLAGVPELSKWRYRTENRITSSVVNVEREKDL